MSVDAQVIDDRNGANAPPKGNGKARLLTLADLDRRTRAYQRTERVLEGLVSDLGGDAHVSFGQRELAQRAAVLSAMLTDNEARWLQGEAIEVDTYLATVNAHRRVLATIGLERRAKDVTPSLNGYFRNDETPS